MHGGKIIHLVVLCLLLTLVALKFKNIDFEKRGKLSPEEKHLTARKKTNKKIYRSSWRWDLALDYTAGGSDFFNCYFNLPPLLPICLMFDTI